MAIGFGGRSMPLLGVVAAAMLCTGAQAPAPAPAPVPVPVRNRPPPEPGYFRVTPTTLGFYRGRAEHLCEWPVGDVSISPTGEFVALTQRLDHPASLAPIGIRLALASRTCIARTGSLGNCILLAEALDDIRPLAWASDDSRLFVTENRRGIAELELIPGADPPARLAARLPASSNVTDTMVPLGATPSRSVAAEVARLQGAFRHAPARPPGGTPPWGIVIGSYANPSGDGALLYREMATLGLTALIDGRRIPLGFGAGAVSEAWMIRPDARSALTFAAPGLAATLERDQWRYRTVAPFSRPLLSSGSGELLGFHSLRSFDPLQPFPGRQPLESELSRQLERRDRAISSVAANGRGDFAYVLTDVRNSDRLSIEGSLRGTRFSASCGDQSPSGAAVEVLDIGTADWPLTSVLVTRPRARGLLLLFPGGPGASIEDFAGHASRFLARGWNVLTISYSGTSGVGVQTFDRLGRGAVATMRRDAELVARHVRRRWPGGPVIIVGGSLGGTPAIATDILLERRAGGLVLLAPFMKSRHPAEWMVASAERGGSASYQLQYEAATMGIADEAAREQLNRDMAALFRTRRANRPALTVFMSYDRQSLPADAAPYFAANTRQEILIGWHGIGMGHSGARQAFDEWVSTHEPSWRQ